MALKSFAHLCDRCLLLCRINGDIAVSPISVAAITTVIAVYYSSCLLLCQAINGDISATAIIAYSLAHLCGYVQAKNIIFWQVAGTVTVGEGAHMKGVLSSVGIDELFKI
jgi:hypothetical protein